MNDLYVMAVLIIKSNVQMYKNNLNKVDRQKSPLLFAIFKNKTFNCSHEYLQLLYPINLERFLVRSFVAEYMLLLVLQPQIYCYMVLRNPEPLFVIHQTRSRMCNFRYEHYINNNGGEVQCLTDSTRCRPLAFLAIF